MIKEFDRSSETLKLVKSLWKQYKQGFYNKFKKGDVPSKSHHLIRYLSKYLFRPQISVKRIKEYNVQHQYVVYEYADHKSGKREIEKVSVNTFIGRMMQQILPKGFHRSRYYGLHHGKNYEKSKLLVLDGLKHFDNREFQRETSLFKVAENSYQSRMKLWTGQDPLKCPVCGHQMEVIKIWTKERGVVFDLLELYKKKGQAPPVSFDGLGDDQVSEPINVIENFFNQLELAI